MKRARGTLLVAVTAAACTTAGTQPARRAAAAVERCEVAGAGSAWCTTVRVRESAASDRELDLRVIILPAQTAARLPDPIVPLAGGPGQGAADLAAALAPRYAPYRDQRDVVFVDQRGTGRANGLHCDSAGATRELMGTLFDAGRLAACRDRRSQHADLTRYTTAAAARDYEAVLDHLGYRAVNIVGTSYGTRLGLEIARQLPARVRSLTLDAVVPAAFTWPTHAAADADAALDALIGDCAADAACRDSFPGFRQDVDAAFARLQRDPVMVAVRDPASGATERVPFGPSDLAYATRGILYGNGALSLPLWFRNAADGDFGALAQAYVTRARALEAQIAFGVHFGVYCAEDLPFVNWTAAARAAAGTQLGTFLLDQYRRVCDIWPRAAIDASFREPVHSPVPALLLAGRRDPVTPPRTAEEAARTLPNSTIVVWPRGGHGSDGLASPNCRVSIMRDFLRTADPDALSLACVTRDAALPFRLR